MTVKYYPDVDMLNISIGGSPDSYEGGEDTSDPDVVFHYDRDRRIVEIEISNASKRVDLDAIRYQYGFEEVRSSETTAAR